MRITKIKYLKEQTIIEWQTQAGEGKWASQSIQSPDEPNPDFKKVLNKLKSDLISILEVESLDKTLIKVTGVSLAYKGEDDTMHAVITGRKSLKNSEGGINLNTPQKAIENTTGEPTASENILSEKCVKIIKDLISEAKLYIEGERIQTDLGLDKE